MDRRDSGPGAADPTLPANNTAETRASPNRVPSAAPRTLGRYQLGDRLGAGGMGQVFRGHDPQLAREVAIKLLNRPEGTGSQAHELEQRLLREAQAMARLSHPNLAVVHDVGSDRGEVFIAMELIAGETLRVWLTRPRPWRQRLAALLAAGRGLAAAHSAGVIHRDFKPDNVLVADDGAVKVVDFGLARGIGQIEEVSPEQRRADVLQSSMTMTGAIMGTPAYMAPEQEIGEPTDERADQFSFAVSVYEALYGRRPFAAGALAAFRAGIPPAAPAAGEIPAALWPLVRRGLASEPEDRHPSVAAMLDALVAAASPPPPWRRAWFVATAAGVLAVGVALALVVSRGDRRVRSEATDAGAPAAPGGRIDQARIQEAVNSHADDVRRCQSEALMKDPQLPGGRVWIEFEIAADGRVKSTRIDDSEAPSPDLAACVGAASMRWQFPKPAGGGAVTVKFPFEFVAAPPFEIERIDADHFRIPRRQLDAWLDDPWALMAARFVPTEIAGKPAGVKVFALAPGSALAALGLESGDTITQIGDLTITGDITIPFKLIDELRPAKAVMATIRRRARTVTLHYQIVD